MKKLRFLQALILAALLLAGAAQAQTPGAAKVPDPNPAAKQLCDTISMITGVAISPLMGVSGVGAYQYFRAKTDEEKAKLPWFANPLFWLPAMVLVGLCFVKDTAGATVLPPGLKKPFDVLETVEHKISGLVATGAFVPVMVHLMHSLDNAGATQSAWSSLGLASVSMPNWLYDILVTPVAMAAFFIVFLASNAINILILISPFGQVDAALKVFRTAIIGTVAGSSVVGSWSGHPWVGAAWALVIILISYLIAGWSFRLSHFGLVFVWDFLTGRKARFKPEANNNPLFLGRKINKVPTRTYGRLSRTEKGELVLTYRPWLVLPERTLVLPEGRYETGRGVFYSEILHVDGGAARTLCLLPPCYLGHEEEVTKIYHFADTRDIGLRAAWAWLKGVFSGASGRGTSPAG